MATAMHPDYAAQCTAIRVELKAWEKSFQSANDGRKAGRADIKAAPHIAAKYKEYQKLRDILDGKSKPQSGPPASPKRKSDPSAIAIYQTPTKKVKHVAVLDNAEPREARDDMLHLSPAKLFMPAPHELGPTPQKDGIVLGLFDHLPADSPAKQRTALSDINANSHLQTPQKRKANFDADEENELVWSGKMARMGRTPVSEGKRHFLDQFATPQKPRRHHEESTPSSRGQATTPVFLRRDYRPIPPPFEGHTTQRMLRKPGSFTRTLSTILQERRKEKEEDARQEAEAKRQAELEAKAQLAADDPDDDEEAAMREMEGGGTDAPVHPKPASSETLVQDSQLDMKLGADGENHSDSEPSEGENGQERKVWKKKGAKRQTRRVNMRPVRTRPQPAQPQPSALDSDDESDATIAETQPAQLAEPVNDDFNDSDSTAVEDEDYESGHTPKKRKVAGTGSSTKKQLTKATAAKKETGAKEENIVKKATRKISAQAHANYKKLKIKNKNSKAGGRSWGRNRR